MRRPRPDETHRHLGFDDTKIGKGDTDLTFLLFRETHFKELLDFYSSPPSPRRSECGGRPILPLRQLARSPNNQPSGRRGDFNTVAKTVNKECHGRMPNSDDSL